MPKQINLTDLIALTFAQNNCYVRVQKPNEVDGLEIDLKSKTWTYDCFTIAIGQDKGHHHRQGVIGVYDSRNIQHLNAMVHAATEATKGPTYDMNQKSTNY